MAYQGRQGTPYTSSYREKAHAPPEPPRPAPCSSKTLDLPLRPSYRLDDEDKEWLCISPRIGLSKRQPATRQVDQTNLHYPSGLDQKLSYQNLAILNLMNKTTPINEQLLGRKTCPPRTSTVALHGPLSRPPSESGADLGEPWGTVSGGRTPSQNADFLAMGAWVDSKAPVDSRPSKLW